MARLLLCGLSMTVFGCALSVAPGQPGSDLSGKDAGASVNSDSGMGTSPDGGADGGGASASDAGSPDAGPQDAGEGRRTEIVGSFIPTGGQTLADFQQYVLPHLANIMVRVDWDALEPDAGVFDFSSLDAEVALWADAGQRVVVVGSLVSDAVVGKEGKNTATPGWVGSAAWAQSCCNAPPLDFITCGSADAGTLKGPMPNVFEAPYLAAAQPFIGALLRHLDSNPHIFYVRVGLMQGGENAPTCYREWPGWSNQQYLSYLSQMAHFAGAVQGNVIFTSDANGVLGLAYADAQADGFHDAGIGTGMEALDEMDAWSYAHGQSCQDDWCAWVSKYPADFHFLQPAMGQDAGALATYVPFAKSFPVDALEIFATDLSIAYNPNDPEYPTWGAAYRAALESP
jgi:hypothetical protein